MRARWFVLVMDMVALGWFVLLGVAPVVAAPAAATFHVATSGTDAAGCGSVLSPCRTIQYAVNMANAGDSVLVAAGTYSGSTTCDAGQTTVCIQKSLTLSGGYATADWGTANPSVNVTTIDGQNARRGVEVVSNSTPQIILQGMTIQNGYAATPISSIGEFSGGGLLCRNSSSSNTNNVTLRQMVLKNNRVQGSGNKAVSGGGASFYYRCQVTLQDVTFDGNQVLGGDAPDGSRGAQALGGGLFATGTSNVTASNITLTNNVAQAGSGGVGWLGSTWNTADGLGGGAAFQLNAVTIDGVTAVGNQARGGSGSSQGGTGSGGGLLFELNTGTVSVTNGTMTDNTATGGSSSGTGGIASGGALMSTDSSLNLQQLQILRNSSLGGAGSDGGDAGGGALYFTRVSMSNPGTIVGTNLIMANNTSQAGAGNNRWGGGGAVFNQNTSLTLIHSTLSNNSVLSSMQGSAIVTLNYLGASNLNLSYSIIANHQGATAIVVQKSGDVGYLNRNLFFNNSADVGSQPGLPPATITNASPLSGNPQFVSADSPNYNYHILSSSSAKDQAVGSTTPVDIDGEARPYGVASDIGADEVEPFALHVTPRNTSLLLDWKPGSSILGSVVNHYEVIVSCPQGASPPYQGACNTPMNVGTQDSLTLMGLTNFKPYTIVVNARDARGNLLLASRTVTASPTNIQVYIPFVAR